MSASKVNLNRRVRHLEDTLKQVIEMSADKTVAAVARVGLEAQYKTPHKTKEVTE